MTRARDAIEIEVAVEMEPGSGWFTRHPAGLRGRVIELELELGPGSVPLRQRRLESPAPPQAC